MGGIHVVVDPNTGLPVPAMYGILVGSGMFDVGDDASASASGDGSGGDDGDVVAPVAVAGRMTAQNLFGVEVGRSACMPFDGLTWPTVVCFARQHFCGPPTSCGSRHEERPSVSE